MSQTTINTSKSANRGLSEVQAGGLSLMSVTVTVRSMALKRGGPEDLYVAVTITAIVGVFLSVSLSRSIRFAMVTKPVSASTEKGEK